MRAVMATGATGRMVELGEVAEPEPKPHEALVEVAAFSPNRGETFLLEQPRPGWRPGKDIAGTVIATGRRRDRTPGRPTSGRTPGSGGLGRAGGGLHRPTGGGTRRHRLSPSRLRFRSRDSRPSASCGWPDRSLPVGCS